MKMKFIWVALLLPVFLVAQNWESNYTNAILKAKNENKLVLLVFSGSDWCAPCIKLDREIWQSATFQEYAEGNYVLYKADFPRKKANKLSARLTSDHKKLAERFNSKGFFPLVIVLDGNENVLGETGYQKLSANDYISYLNDFIIQ